MFCKLCKERGYEKSYEGETHRNMHIRGNEHTRGLKNKSPESPLWKHVNSDHKEEQNKVEFEMELTGTFRKVTSRLINEGVRIKNRDRNSLLNSKSAFYGPAVKRKTYEKSSYKCHKCQNSFTFKDQLENHKKDHESQPYGCQRCDKTFISKVDLRKHKNIHEGNKPYVCELCKVKFSDEKDINNTNVLPMEHMNTKVRSVKVKANSYSYTGTQHSKICSNYTNLFINSSSTTGPLFKILI